LACPGSTSAVGAARAPSCCDRGNRCTNLPVVTLAEHCRGL
jgi:hypothetical protein